jgi:MFS family permease
MPRPRDVLRLRNFRLLFAARTISFFGTNLAPIAVAFAVLGLSNSASDVGLAFAAWTLAQVCTLLIGGVIADRLPRRLVMIASDSASFCVRAAMGALLVSGHAHVWELVVLQAVGGAAVAFHSPASTGLVAETVPEPLLQQANGLMSVARYAAFPLGAAVGGTLVATVGSGYALLLDASTYALSALLLACMRLPARAAKATAPNFVRELVDGWRAFTEHTWVWLLTGWISLYFLVTYAPFFVLGPYIAKHSLGGATAWTIVVTGEAIGSLARRPRRTTPPAGAFVGGGRPAFRGHFRPVRAASRARPGPGDRRGSGARRFRVLFRNRRLGNEPPGADPAGEALPGRRVQLVRRNGVPARRLRDRRSGSAGDRNVDDPLDRRRLDRRDDGAGALRSRCPRFPRPPHGGRTARGAVLDRHGPRKPLGRGDFGHGWCVPRDSH